METEARLAAIKQETPTVKSFVLDLNGEEMDFLPGQYVDIYVETRGRHEVAGYSITSSPLQRDTISIAVKKLRGARSTIYLHERARVGDSFFLAGPGGEFYYKAGAGTSLVLVAGGIGITPLMSMVRYVHQAQPMVRVTLLYSARRPSELAFFEELSTISAQNPNIRCLFTVTQPQQEPWEGRLGRIDSEMLQESITDADSVFYICGPVGMPEHITAVLGQLGVDESRIMAEIWW